MKSFHPFKIVVIAYSLLLLLMFVQVDRVEACAAWNPDTYTCIACGPGQQLVGAGYQGACYYGGSLVYVGTFGAPGNEPNCMYMPLYTCVAVTPPPPPPPVCVTNSGTVSCADYGQGIGTIWYTQRACTYSNGDTIYETPTVTNSSCVQTVCVPNAGNACSSSANSCGMTNSGTVQCDGSCSATTPSNSYCPAPQPSVCTDWSASNYGQALPCKYTPTTCGNGATNYPACNNNLCTDATAINYGGYLPCSYPQSTECEVVVDQAFSCADSVARNFYPSTYTQGTIHVVGAACSDGSSQIAIQSGSCSQPSYSNCAASVVNNCAVGPASHGQTAGSCQNGSSGNCSYTCYDGVWTIPSGNSCTIAPVELTAFPRIIEIGGSVTFTASLNGHTNCSVTGGGKTIPISSTVTESFSETIRASTTYTLSCTLSEGSVTDSVTVEIVPRAFES